MSFQTNRSWWLRPIVTVPASNERPATCKETWFSFLPGIGGVFTFLLLVLTLFLIDKTHYHGKVSIQSIAVDDSSAIWQVDFLVKNPSSRYSIYYDDDVAVKLGSLNAAVLNVTKKLSYRDLSAFSLMFVVKGNRNVVVYEELDIKLRARHKNFLNYNEAGLFHIKCQNQTRRHGNINKIKCRSSFSHLKLLISDD